MNYWNMCCALLLTVVAVVALADDALDAGALSPEGKTIDPLTIAQQQADQVWAAKAPPKGAAVKAYPCRIVAYADDMARHDCGSYCKPRPFQFAEDVDVDGDGRVDDDLVAYMPFSMTETLSMPNWPGLRSGPLRLPERMNATMHGGRSWWIANVSPKNRKSKRAFFCNEIGINPNHCPPFRDGRAEDHPLQGRPDESSGSSFLLNYITKVWKKADFLNDGDKHRVTFDETSRLASLCTRGYWYGYDEVRLVVLDEDQWYISDMDQFDIPKDMKEYRAGRLFLCYPTKATWAKWSPAGYRNNFDATKATFAAYEFKDVQAVGWHLAKVNRTPSNSHIKWYGFEADAVVHRPEQPSVNIDMVEIRGQESEVRGQKTAIPPFHITTCEIPYAFWKKGFRYGDAPINTLDARYTFARSGDMGSMRFGSKEHVQNEPVTNLTLYDVLAFANCLSQLEGKTPVYYVDPEFKTHFRNMHIALCSDGPDLTTGHDVDVGGKKPVRMHCNSKIKNVLLPKIHVKWDANGHRLPTAAEWKAAAGKVADPQATDGTQPVGQGEPNANGLYDTAGNVRELVWTYGDVFDPEKHDTQTVMGGDFHGPGDALAADRAASPYGDVPFDGNHNIGLRLVCRKSGLAAPPSDSAPGGTVFKKGQKTQARKTVEPVREPVLEMADIPGGTFSPQESVGGALTVSSFKMAKHEVTFVKWEAVRHWGEANGYVFSREGHMGSMYWYHFPHTPDEPVTFMAWHDAAVWCNALSEMEGRTPFYYTDPEKTDVYRKAFPYRPVKYAGWDLVGEHGNQSGKELDSAASEPWLHQKWDGDGYRLPTRAEFLYALEGGTGSQLYWGKEGKPDDHAWTISNAGGRTHCVGLKKPNSFGLYDMVGNVYEWSNSCPSKRSPRDQRYDTNNPKHSRYWSFGLGKKFQYTGIQNPYHMGGSWFFGGDRNLAGTDTSNEYMPDYGFRVVRCEAGVHPPDGEYPIEIPILLTFDEKDYDELAGATHRNSLRRDGIFPTAGVAELKGVKWKTDLGGPIKSSPVVTGGVVYIGGPGGFHALDAKTGQQRWHIPVNNGGVESSACIAKGAVYFTGMDGKVYAADAETGQLKWRTQPRGTYGRALMSTPAVAYNIVFASAGDGIAGFDVETGKETYRCPAGAPKGRRAITLVGRYFFGGTVVRIDNGTSLYHPGYIIQWCSDGRETTCVVGDRYFAASSGRGGYEFARVGCGDWTARQTQYSIRIEEHLPQVQRSYTSTAPTVWDGKVFMATDNGIMYAFDAMRGKKLDWEFNADKNNGLHSTPSVAAKSGILYFGSQSGDFFAVDTQTAKEKWRTRLGGAIETSPWPGDGVIFVGCDDGYLYAIE